MTVGVLAVQGDVREHLRTLARLGVAGCPVLRPEQLARLAGIILPGGESTAMWRLMTQTGLAAPLREALAGGLPAFGTCAGMILLARRITNWGETFLGVLDVAVERNATGRQADSFEARVSANGLGEIPAVFIRAPLVRQMGPTVKALAWLGDVPVLVQEGHLLAASFHPELTGDARVHDVFIQMCRKERRWQHA
ncbi:MAG TPA: pyridoxal 5'-phosphate synthase glutaminase subunit PdxT [Candidatus Bipolaricaulis sp.]|nr:pyridoxal 5'-phosphate synthase glutaminase subunit PdxT [Candidatus Bipolaricaulis sp.]MDY0392653.1 pyridoxal 5'-phosphate synthase glutaminase subunit PdxT [Candidatus Bipolaricaulis sp.]HPD07075.1 pyridoxal 5'-phosphate synthase glutaminase subunit PdxT [Candidatus Bipolaricaulis sp.]HRS13883.1 pyridoxal 5'-phosphate synthase glutaminase subunit PdxT [Candidatus Bipolaricaulis sp.]HRU21409.1 pyridoxal 5'-phosphate synthase glutaminase subunit PdxT [Candidatus Bipolaricaulis sp.]